MEGCDGVFHEAALGSVPRSVEFPVDAHAANATGTLVSMCVSATVAVVGMAYWGIGSTVSSPSMTSRARSWLS